MINCPLSVTPAQFYEIAKCEAIVVSEFENADGSRFGEVVGWGDEPEMRDLAQTTDIIILPCGITSLGKVVVLVSTLLERMPDASVN